MASLRFSNSLMPVILLLACTAKAVEPFKLLTVEPATVPTGNFVLGLTETGLGSSNTFIDTNTAMDVLYTPNLGVKTVVPFTETTAMTMGARYLQFVGTSAADTFAQQQQGQIKKFQLNFSGYNLFTGVSFPLYGASTGHFNLQYANVSDSQVMNAIFAWNAPVLSKISLVTEGGYDFANKLPRASFGLLVTGARFGLRAGVTYAGITDALGQIPLLPVLDLFWQFGGE